MNLISMISAATLILAVSATHAQERSAAQPFNTQGDITNTEILRKISYLQQLAHTLEKQIADCNETPASSSNGINLNSSSSRENVISPGNLKCLKSRQLTPYGSVYSTECK